MPAGLRAVWRPTLWPKLFGADVWHRPVAVLAYCLYRRRIRSAARSQRSAARCLRPSPTASVSAHAVILTTEGNVRRRHLAIRQPPPQAMPATQPRSDWRRHDDRARTSKSARVDVVYWRIGRNCRLYAKCLVKQLWRRSAAVIAYYLWRRGTAAYALSPAPPSTRRPCCTRSSA